VNFLFLFRAIDGFAVSMDRAALLADRSFASPFTNRANHFIVFFVFCLSLVSPLSSYCTHCMGQQLVLYLALLPCSVKLHVVLLFEQIKKEGRKDRAQHFLSTDSVVVC